MTAASNVYTHAADLLSVVVDGYADAETSLPSRQYVADGGEVALDCELVAVALGRVYRGTPNNNIDFSVPQRCVGIRTAEFHVWIVRCASMPDDEGNPPSTDVIQGLALPMMTDAWLLPYVIAEAIGTALPLCDNISIGELIVHGPEGGFVGVDLIVEVQLG